MISRNLQPTEDPPTNVFRTQHTKQSFLVPVEKFAPRQLAEFTRKTVIRAAAAKARYVHNSVIEVPRSERPLLVAEPWWTAARGTHDCNAIALHHPPASHLELALGHRAARSTRQDLQVFPEMPATR